ncbi:Glycine-rich RNA-binding protein 2, mitochondrial [Paramarasmius palmivorus]|uniref:Glycine-rich RNA-binding protein 2, mitochondrial n=1 Tax=Paramarasmius palmivorus TaxID=297713 RepID=A0AAW0CJT1_9AGAR
MGDVHTVLVTGGTGFIGSHIIKQLLEQQYRVRATARSAARLQSVFPDAGHQLEVVEVATLTSDYTEALRGVDAIIHCASPIPLKEKNNMLILQQTVEGANHLIQQSLNAGVKKIVYTSSISALFPVGSKAAFDTELVTAEIVPSVSLDEVKIEEHNPISIYQVAKIAAENNIWNLARCHPEVDFTVIIPPATFGPFVPNYPFASDQLTYGSNGYIFQLLSGQYQPNAIGHGTDVRDIAKAHVLALRAPRPSNGQDKRFFVNGKIFTWEEVVRIIRKERPELSARLPSEGAVCPVPQTKAPTDDSFVKEVLGLTEFVPWRKTVLDTIDAIDAIEEKRSID